MSQALFTALRQGRSQDQISRRGRAALHRAALRPINPGPQVQRHSCFHKTHKGEITMRTAADILNQLDQLAKKHRHTALATSHGVIFSSDPDKLKKLQAILTDDDGWVN